MRVYNDLNNFDIQSTVITVGTFDGVHFGHRQILNALIKKASEIDATPVIFTFLPHPKIFFQTPENPISLLNSISEKIEIFKSLGIENVVVYPFDKDFSQIKFENFIKHYLIDIMNMKALVVGHDNHFGRDKNGNFESIKEFSSKYNFEITQVPELKDHYQKISSTTIKNLLLDSKLKLANNLLGYNYKLKGKVVKGFQIGSKIGFPTANIQVDNNEKLIPANGVYVAKIEIENIKYNSVLSIGYNSTFIEKQNVKTIEVHILDFNKNIYDLDVKIEFVEYIRTARKFINKEELIKQIEKDIEKSKHILGNQ